MGELGAGKMIQVHVTRRLNFFLWTQLVGPTLTWPDPSYMPPHIERIEKKKLRTGVERQFRGHFSKAEKPALVIACTWPNLISLFIFKQQKKISRDMISHSPECPHSLVLPSSFQMPRTEVYYHSNKLKIFNIFAKFWTVIKCDFSLFITIAEHIVVHAFNTSTR